LTRSVVDVTFFFSKKINVPVCIDSTKLDNREADLMSKLCSEKKGQSKLERRTKEIE